MRAYRSPLKLFVFGIVGVVLMAAAADVMFGHWVSTPPDNNEGVLTTRGLAQQRGDLMWGGTMLTAGLILFGGSVTELVRRRPVVLISGDGLVVDTGGDGTLIPWRSVEDVSSGVVVDTFDGVNREQLVVDLKPGTEVSTALASLHHDGDRVLIDAHDWAVSVTETALAAQGARSHFMRLEQFRDHEPPSIVWETTIDQGEPAEENE